MNYREQLFEIFEKHKQKVAVHCDEYHAHSALNDCLRGDFESIQICKMWEYIKILEARLLQIQILTDTSKIE